MKKYRSGHDYLFVADNPFMYKGDYIGATSVNVLFKVFDAEGNEKLFESEELEEQELFSKDGKPYYLCDFINCYIDKEHVLNFEPNMTVFREIGCPYTLQWEKSYYTKDILIGHTLHPKNISEDEFLDIMKNNMELFDIRDNLPAQTTTFFTQEIMNKVEVVNELFKNSSGVLEDVMKEYLINFEKIEQGQCEDESLIRFDNCISYISDVGFDIRGWKLYAMPTFYTHCFWNEKTKEMFDLAVWEIGEVIPRYLDSHANEQDAKTIQEAIKRWSYDKPLIRDNN